MLGAKHPEVLASWHNLADALKGEKQFAEALLSAQRARERRREVLGENHPYFKDSAKLCEEIEAALAKEKADGR